MSIAADAVHPDLARLRQALLADPAAQERLDRFDMADAFIPAALAYARDAGIALDEPTLKTGLRGDPIGFGRFSGAPPTAARPPPGWLPIQVAMLFGEFCIDWAYFGARPLSESFFELDSAEALRRPLNRLARYRTRLLDLPAWVEQFAPVAPSGFIFHMSRCGSTLVSQMLAADPRHAAFSEPPPLDQTLMATFQAPGEARRALVKAMILALTYRCAAAGQRAFLKLDSWHVLALPLFREIFPDVPWVFLYRDPQMVLASQMSERGMQTLPEVLPPAVFGLSHDDVWPSDVYCARLLARTCAAVRAPLAQGGGLLVNYNELPDAGWTRILPHYGVAADAAMRARMAEAAGFDAKSRGQSFSRQADVKNKVLTSEMSAVAAQEIGPIYRELEALRLTGRPQ